MNTNPDFSNTLKSIFLLSLGGDDFQTWVDRYQEKYDNLTVDGYTKDPLKTNYTWQQLVASTGATPLPTWVDPESPGYEVALRSLSGATGNLPTAKQFYRFNRVIMREKLQMIQAFNGVIPAGMQSVFMSLMDESTDGLIKSYHNALVHQSDRINSTGYFTLESDNNPRGYNGVKIDFNIPTNHFDTLTGTERWFTNEDGSMTTEGKNSDPIEYCKNIVKKIRRTYHITRPLEMRISKDLWDAVCEHSKVLDRVARRIYRTISNEDTLTSLQKDLNESEIMDTFARLIKVEKITVRDSMAYVSKPGTNADGEPDLVDVPVENFKRTNISFIPVGNVGTIQGVRPLTIGYDPDEVAEYDEGRLVLTQRAEKATHSIYIESEFAQLCVPNNVNAMFICTVTA
ncbi:MAG: hypothetical protein K2M94_04000 [Paramuribaculum sp.]|nr:hypothetical protein [Paramuribaculum sp.]